MTHDAFRPPRRIGPRFRIGEPVIAVSCVVAMRLIGRGPVRVAARAFRRLKFHLSRPLQYRVGTPEAEPVQYAHGAAFGFAATGESVGGRRARRRAFSRRSRRRPARVSCALALRLPPGPSSCPSAGRPHATTVNTRTRGRRPSSTSRRDVSAHPHSGPRAQTLEDRFPRSRIVQLQGRTRSPGPGRRTPPTESFTQSRRESLALSSQDTARACAAVAAVCSRAPQSVALHPHRAQVTAAHSTRCAAPHGAVPGGPVPRGARGFAARASPRSER